MAVYLSTGEVNIDYMLAGNHLGDCVGGGEDYRVMTKGTTTSDTLLIRGWAGDNISDACKLVSVKLENLETRIRNDSGNKPISTDEYYVKIRLKASAGSVSDTSFTETTCIGDTIFPSITKTNNSSWETAGNGYEISLEGLDVSETAFTRSANIFYPALTIGLSTDISLSTTTRRVQLKNIRLSAMRTRACYVWFKGSFLQQKTMTCDYGTVPSYGSTPTTTGYVFKGWKSSADGVTYIGTLPTAYETDVEYTAVWEIAKHTITVNATSGGTVTGSGTYEYGSDVTLTATPDAGYRFVNWSDAVENEEIPATRHIDVWSDATYTAEFAPKSYTVSYNGNGATRGSVSSQSVSTFADTTLTANAFKKQYTVTLNPNYSGGATQALTSSATFKGWEDRNDIKASNGTTYSYTEFDAPFYANTYGDLYNAFKYNKQNLVNHWANNGISEGRKATGSPRGVYPDQAVVNTLNGIYADNEIEVNLYAQWSDMLAVTLPTPTRSGYNFMGWYTASSGGTKVGNGGSSYTPNANVTLYAQWEVAKINKLYIGTSQPKSLYVGTSEVKAVYRGTTKIYG